MKFYLSKLGVRAGPDEGVANRGSTLPPPTEAAVKGYS